MTTLTNLERAALVSIFTETPSLAAALAAQMAVATVIDRDNTGAGFFTTLSVPGHVPPVASTRVLGYETHAHVLGLEHGLGFVLFLQEGRLHVLEGYACAPESTVALDLNHLECSVYRIPVRRIE